MPYKHLKKSRYTIKVSPIYEIYDFFIDFFQPSRTIVISYFFIGPIEVRDRTLNIDIAAR